MAMSQQNENNTEQLPQETYISVDLAVLKTCWAHTRKFSVTRAWQGLAVQENTRRLWIMKELPQKQTKESEMPREQKLEIILS